MKKNFILIMLLFTSVFLVSCSKDKINKKLLKNDNISLSDDLKLVFSKKHKVERKDKKIDQILSIYKYEGNSSSFLEQFDENTKMSTEKNSSLEGILKDYLGFDVPDEYKHDFSNDEYEWRLTGHLIVIHFKNKNMIYIFTSF